MADNKLVSQLSIPVEYITTPASATAAQPDRSWYGPPSPAQIDEYASMYQGFPHRSANTVSAFSRNMDSSYNQRAPQRIMLQTPQGVPMEPKVLNETGYAGNYDPRFQQEARNEFLKQAYQAYSNLPAPKIVPQYNPGSYVKR